MVSVWIAIALTVLATVSTKVGLVFLKKGIKPQGEGVFWYLGMGMLVGGMAVYMVANSIRAAPISLLQPIYASGWIVLAIMAVSVLHERFQALEWAGLGFLFAGVLLLGMSVEQGQAHSAAIDRSRLLAYLAAAAIGGLGVFLILRTRRTWADHEVLFGILAGLLLGVGYLSVKVCPLAWSDGEAGLALLGLAGMGVGLIGGLAVIQWGYHHGRALIVSSVNLVINQVLVVAGGIWCLGERLPELAFPYYARVAGLVAVLGGTLMLGRFGASNVGEVRSQ
jgi:drug/metabolite transporter (DMT)-like permease